MQGDNRPILFLTCRTVDAIIGSGKLLEERVALPAERAAFPA